MPEPDRSGDKHTADEQTRQLRRYHERGYLAYQHRKLKRDTNIDTGRQSGQGG